MYEDAFEMSKAAALSSDGMIYSHHVAQLDIDLYSLSSFPITFVLNYFYFSV